MEKKYKWSTKWTLNQDIQTPSSYYKAGDERTAKEWNKLFNGSFYYSSAYKDVMPTSREYWEEQADMKSENNIMWNIVNEVFKEKKLHSITYKNAAVISIERYLKLKQTK